MAQINVFRLRMPFTDSTEGYLQLMGDVLRTMAYSDTDETG